MLPTGNFPLEGKAKPVTAHRATRVVIETFMMKENEGRI